MTTIPIDGSPIDVSAFGGQMTIAYLGGTGSDSTWLHAQQPDGEWCPIGIFVGAEWTFRLGFGCTAIKLLGCSPGATATVEAA
jgi:hypothetical protein